MTDWCARLPSHRASLPYLDGLIVAFPCCHMQAGQASSCAKVHMCPAIDQGKDHIAWLVDGTGHSQWGPCKTIPIDIEEEVKEKVRELQQSGWQTLPKHQPAACRSIMTPVIYCQALLLVTKTSYLSQCSINTITDAQRLLVPSVTTGDRPNHGAYVSRKFLQLFWCTVLGN